MTFEKEIVKSFLQALGWSRYDGNLEEQYGLYSRKWIPDFVFYLNNDKNAKEIILEGKVRVNGEVCLQRGKKLVEGDKVTLDSETIEIVKS